MASGKNVPQNYASITRRRKAKNRWPVCMRKGHSYRWGEIRGKTVNSLMFTLNFHYKGQGTEVKS